MPKTSYPLDRDTQQAFDRAVRIAGSHNQKAVDSLMLLLALLQYPNSQVQMLFKYLSVKVESLIARSAATIKLDANQTLQIPGVSRGSATITEELDGVLNAALIEMKQQGQVEIDAPTLLLGMLQISDSKAGQILSQYFITAEQVRGQIAAIKQMPVVKKPLFASRTMSRVMRQGISPIFISLVLFTLAMAVFLFTGVGNSPRMFLIAFIIGGWIISVALHEFGHAVIAFWGGDESVEDKGYLTLNPLKYSNPVLSIILPIFMLLIGGIGFPGGAVYINIFALRKPWYRSLVSAAGPFANLLFVILLAIPFSDLLFYSIFGYALDGFLSGLAFLAFLQITAIMINLLPIPGLDGFGILEPFLPTNIVEASRFFRSFGFLILYLLVFVDSPISNTFWTTVWSFTQLLSPNLAYYANMGLKIFLAK